MKLSYELYDVGRFFFGCTWDRSFLGVPCYCDNLPSGAGLSWLCSLANHLTCSSPNRQITHALHVMHLHALKIANSIKLIKYLLGCQVTRVSVL